MELRDDEIEQKEDEQQQQQPPPRRTNKGKQRAAHIPTARTINPKTIKAQFTGFVSAYERANGNEDADTDSLSSQAFNRLASTAFALMDFLDTLEAESRSFRLVLKNKKILTEYMRLKEQISGGKTCNKQIAGDLKKLINRLDDYFEAAAQADSLL